MTIIDSIKRVNQFMSSIREVLPGREYFIPETTKKLDPLNINYSLFLSNILAMPQPIGKAIYKGITGISPLSPMKFAIGHQLTQGNLPRFLMRIPVFIFIGILIGLYKTLRIMNFHLI